MPLVSSGGASQVKDTGHNGMESIGICLPVLTLSVFLVREIRTDNHLHPSPPPRAHTLQSQAQSHRTAPASSFYQQNRAQGRGEKKRGAGAIQHPRCCHQNPHQKTPLLRFFIPRNFRNWDGGCGENALRVRCPPPTHLASPALAHLYSKTPSARRTGNSNADRPPPARRGPCGEGGRLARREPGTPTPSPAGGGQPAAGTPPPQI